MATIKIAGLSAPKSFLARFEGSDTTANIEDGNVSVEITVPGLEGNKGNSILRCSLLERDDMLSEIEEQALGMREMTPAEIVRRTAQWEGEGNERVFCFQTSEAKGSRTHRIPAADVGDFIATLSDRFDAVETQVANLEAEANAE